MSEIKFDQELIASLCLEIGDRQRLIAKLFAPMEDQTIIKHLAASAIHNTMFMKDVYNHLEGTKEPVSALTKKFLDECGCDFNKEDKNE